MGKHRRIGMDRSGAAAAEYALVLAILGAALTFGALSLGTAVTDSLEEPTPCVSGAVAADADCR